MKEYQTLQYVADLFRDIVLPSVTPDSELWTQYSKNIWEIDQEDEAFSRLVAALNQFCLVLIGSAGSLVDSAASFLISMISSGGLLNISFHNRSLTFQRQQNVF